MSALKDRLERRVEASRDESFRPELFELSRPEHREAVDERLRRHPEALVHDELRTQVAGLFETRDPAGTLDKPALARKVKEALGDDPTRYGRWAWYPWSRRLVHILPEAEYRELRTSRNRNKITFEEQQKLRGLHIGIVGLSIGQAAAVTLTLEEVGGYLALADFDQLELSNMNRLRAGVQGLGVNKAVLAAREVYEINPYASVDVWTGGVTPANIDAFLCAGGRPFDLVYEECDDLQSKVLIRERARHHRIPVLMETSDRGLMDIERFDLEPERPLFHGLVGEVHAEELANLTTFQKVPLVMKIIGRGGMSDRFAASMVDIEASLKSWPQLASEVALGAGINVDTARRIALGQLNSSGRFYLDMHQVISDGKGQVEAAPEVETGVSKEAVHGFRLPSLSPVRGQPSADDLRALVAWVTTAFSGGNCQPWSFTAREGKLQLHHEVKRSESFLDVHHRASYLAFGSVLENLALVAPAMGLDPQIRLFPDEGDPRWIAEVGLRPGAVRLDPLLRFIPERVTNRQLGTPRPLDPDHQRRLDEAVQAHGCEVAWVTQPAGLEEAAAVIGRGDRLRMLSQVMHREMMGEMRWSLEEVERTRDGIDVATLELTPTDLAGMKVIQSWPVMKMVGMVGGGVGLERPTRKSIRGCRAVGLLTVEGTSPRSFVRAGRALQRLWLQATADGVAFQPMTALTYVFHRLVHAGGEGFSAAEIRELTELRKRYAALFPVRPDRAEPMLFRVGYAPPPSARSLRRPVEDVLRIIA